MSDAGGGHAHCGFTICLSDEFPAEMRGSALFFNIHGHRMNRDQLVRKGSGWTGKHAPDLMLSMDEWFLGVALESGPGGGAVLHRLAGQDELPSHRRRALGPRQRPGLPAAPRRGEAVEGRLGERWATSNSRSCKPAATSGNCGPRGGCCRSVRRKGKKLDEAAIGFLHETVKSHADPTRRLRALWCLEACGSLDRRYVPAADEDESVRSWAVRLATAGEKGEGRESWLEFAAKESSPVVLLSLCSSLQKLPPDLALDMAEKIAPKMIAADPNLTRMFWFGFEALVPRDEKRALAIALGSPDERLVKWTARRLGSPDASDLGGGRCGRENGAAVRCPAGPARHQAGRALVSRATGSAGQARVPREMRRSKEKVEALLSRSGSREAIAKLWSQVEDRKAAVAERLSALKLLAPSLGKDDDNRLAGLTDDPALRLPVLMARPSLIDHRRPATG